MKRALARFALTTLACGPVLLTGCLNLKPAADPTRRFILNPLPATNAIPAPSLSLALGIGPVAVSSYLDDDRLLIRRGLHEIQYNDFLRWGEPPDKGIQRVLALNLSRLLGTREVYSSGWRRDAVSCEVHVQLERFDVETEGKVVLEAFWHISRPGTGQRLHAGVTRLEKQSAPPAADPEPAVSALSDLLGDLSREIAGVLRTLCLSEGDALHPGGHGPSITR